MCSKPGKNSNLDSVFFEILKINLPIISLRDCLHNFKDIQYTLAITRLINHSEAIVILKH